VRFCVIRKSILPLPSLVLLFFFPLPCDIAFDPSFFLCMKSPAKRLLFPWCLVYSVPPPFHNVVETFFSALRGPTFETNGDPEELAYAFSTHSPLFPPLSCLHQDFPLRPTERRVPPPSRVSFLQNPFSEYNLARYRKVLLCCDFCHRNYGFGIFPPSPPR